MANKDVQVDEFYDQAERRIGWLTLLIGLAAAAIVLPMVSPLTGVGVAVGTILAWVNYRWLEGGIDALVRLSTERKGTPPRVSSWVYTKLFARYALIGLVLYFMVALFRVPILSILAGLFALGAAAAAEVIYEIFLGFK